MRSLSKKTENDTLLARSLKFLSEAAMKNNDYEKAKKYAIEGLKAIDSIKNKKIYFRSIIQLGRVHDFFQEYKNAIKTYKRALPLYLNEEILDEEITKIYLNLGTAYLKLRKETEAVDYFLKGGEIAKNNNNYDDISYTMYTLGYLYMGLEQYMDAEKYFLKGLKDSTLIKNKGSLYMNHRALGLNYSRWGKFEKALSHNKIALGHYRRIGNKLYEYDILNNTSALYNKIQEFEKAIIYGNMALNIGKEIEHKQAINGAKINLASAFIGVNNYNDAEVLIRDIAQDTSDIKLISRPFKAVIYQKLSVVYENKNDFKKSLKYYIRYSILNDSILKEQRDSNIAEIQTKYETEQKEKENLQLRAENAEQELITAKANREKTIYAFGFLGALIVLSVFFYFYRKTKKQKEVIESLQKELHHRVKNNLSIIDTFIEVAKEEFEDNKFSIKLTES
jgi:tetratricopeptide (TPR) repeat protein